MPRPADSRAMRAASSPEASETADESAARFRRSKDERRAAPPSMSSAPEGRVADFGAQCGCIERKRTERLGP